MKNKIISKLFCFIALLLLGCSKDQPIEPQLTNPIDSQLTNKSLQQRTTGATQISGVGYYATPEQCDTEGQGADYTVYLTGDLIGCLYTYVDAYDCSPGGIYIEEGREFFVGTYKGEEGSFWTNYKFEAKFEGCEGGLPVGAEIFGRCQHPILKDSGQGMFEGVTGRFDMKDDVEAVSFAYKGNLKYN